MTPQQQTKQSNSPSTPATIDSLATDTLNAILEEQTTINTDAGGDTYIPIDETNLTVIPLETLSPGAVLYDPRNPTMVLEVIEHYQNDFSEQKVRVRVHSNDHRNGRLNSYFAQHIPRDFTYVLDEPSDDTNVEYSVEAHISAWGGDTADETDEQVQTTLHEQNTSPNSKSWEDTSTESPEDSTTQDTLF